MMMKRKSKGGRERERREGGQSNLRDKPAARMMTLSQASTSASSHQQRIEATMNGKKGGGRGGVGGGGRGKHISTQPPHSAANCQQVHPFRGSTNGDIRTARSTQASSVEKPQSANGKVSSLSAEKSCSLRAARSSLSRLSQA